MTLYCLKGNYVNIAKSLGFSEQFYQSTSQGTYLEHIRLDLHRTHYFDDQHTESTIQEQLIDVQRLNEQYCYSQGDFDGGIFTLGYKLLLPDVIQQQANSSLREEHDGFSHDLRLSYIDDDGTLSALSILAIRDDENLDIPLMERRSLFIAAVIKPSNAAVTERQVTFLTHERWQPTTPVSEETTVNILPDQEINHSLMQAINCKALSSRLDGIIQGESIAAQKFEQLILELSNHQKKIKLRMLADIHLLWASILNKPSLIPDTQQRETILNTLEEKVRQLWQQDTDYFKTHSMLMIKHELDTLYQTPWLQPLFNTFTDTLRNEVLQIDQKARRKLRVATQHRDTQHNLLTTLEQKQAPKKSPYHNILFGVSWFFAVGITILSGLFLSPLGLLGIAIGVLCTLLIQRLSASNKPITPNEAALKSSIDQRYQSQATQIEQEFMKKIRFLGKTIKAPEQTETKHSAKHVKVDKIASPTTNRYRNFSPSVAEPESMHMPAQEPETNATSAPPSPQAKP